MSPLFLFETGDYEFMHLITTNEKMTLTELLIHLVAWIRLANELNNRHKERAVSPKFQVACLQERKDSAAHANVF